MPFTILLNEEDIRSMGPQLQDSFLKWYFHREVPTNELTNSSSLPTAAVPLEEGNPRVSFPDLFRRGLLEPGDEIYCRSLKRQRRQGAEEFIKGARVTTEGAVEFGGQKFFKPSKLALEMVNANKPAKPAEALNGYAYLYALKGGALVLLDDLRRRLVAGGGSSTSEKGSPGVEAPKASVEEIRAQMVEKLKKERASQKARVPTVDIDAIEPVQK